MTVWLKYPPHPWHAIRSSLPGDRITFACIAWIPYVADAPTHTNPPVPQRCPACERELRRTVQTLALHVDPVVEVVDTPQDWHGEPTQGGE